MTDDIIDDPNDPLAKRVAAMEAARYQPETESALAEPQEAPEPEEVTEPNDDTQPEPEAAQDTPEPEHEVSEEDELRERVKRAHIAAREEKRRAKMLEQELEVLRGNRLEPQNETIQRQAAIMAAQMAEQQVFTKETQRIAKALGKSAQPVIDAFAEAFPNEGGVPPALVQAVIEASDGQEHLVLKHLADNIDEAERIYGLAPARQGAALAKIAMKLTAPKAVSKAPAPIRPVGGANKSTSSAPTGNFDSMSYTQKVAYLEAMEKSQVRQ